jgi:hypothetical protein
VAVYAFDGRSTIQLIADFSATKNSVTTAIDGITCDGTKLCADPSTNLYGAVVQALDQLDSTIKNAKSSLTLGSLVIFTDGTDQASRITREAARSRIDFSPNDMVQTIGLGNEIDQSVLGADGVGRDGFQFAADDSSLVEAFQKAATKILNLANSYYEARYCSPRRAGQHELTVNAVNGGAAGRLTAPYSADNFGATCVKSLVVPDAGACNAIPDGGLGGIDSSALDGAIDIGNRAYDAGVALDSAQDAPLGDTR